MSRWPGGSIPGVGTTPAGAATASVGTRVKWSGKQSKGVIESARSDDDDDDDDDDIKVDQKPQ